MRPDNLYQPAFALAPVFALAFVSISSCTSPDLNYSQGDSASSTASVSEALTTSDSSSSPQSSLDSSLDGSGENSQNPESQTNPSPSSDENATSSPAPKKTSDSPDPSSASSSTTAPDSTSSTTSDNDEATTGPSAPGKVTIVNVRSEGTGCVFSGFGANATKKLSASKAQGPKDSFQVVFDDMVASLLNRRTRIQCALLIDIKWNKGTRAVVDVRKNGHISLKNPGSFSNITLQSDIGFIRGKSTQKTTTYNTNTEKDYSFDWKATDLGVYSDCSGSGQFRLNVEYKIRKNNHHFRYTVGLDQVSGIFRVAEDSESDFPACD